MNSQRTLAVLVCLLSVALSGCGSKSSGGANLRIL